MLRHTNVIQETSLVECSLLKLVKVLLDILQKDLNIIPILFLILSLGNNFFESTQVFLLKKNPQNHLTAN